MSDVRLRVLIAEDQAIVRDGLAALVGYQADFEVAAWAADGTDAVRLFRELRPDVVLMDLRMPRMGGVEAIEAIRSADPQARILVLTTYDGDEEIYRALQAGACGYLLKDASTEELIGAIRNRGTGGTAHSIGDRSTLGRPGHVGAIAQRARSRCAAAGGGRSHEQGDCGKTLYRGGNGEDAPQ